MNCNTTCIRLTEDELLPFLPKRSEEANKGTYGHVLLLAGSKGMAGAAVLSGEAAYRSGCGLVAVAGPEENRVILQIALPEALYQDQEKAALLGRWATAVGAGPGIGTSEDSWNRLKGVLEAFSGPAVLDADALNLLSLHPKEDPLQGREGIVITPHPKEMSRLCGESVERIIKDPAGIARSFAEEHRLICVLKGHRTVVSDGKRTYVNESGCEGMAVGGSGDVLTGILTSLAAQSPGSDLFYLTCLGVYLHGRAGEAAAERLGSRSMLARDIVNHLSAVFQH